MLHPTDDEDFDSDDEEDDGQGGYSMTPVAKAVVLFDSCLKKQTASLAQEQRLDEDWMLGDLTHSAAGTTAAVGSWERRSQIRGWSFGRGPWRS